MLHESHYPDYMKVKMIQELLDNLPVIGENCWIALKQSKSITGEQHRLKAQIARPHTTDPYILYDSAV